MVKARGDLLGYYIPTHRPTVSLSHCLTVSLTHLPKFPLPLRALPHTLRTVMPSVLKRTLSTLALLLVACAQIFGMDRGFLCDCGGIEKVTRVDHCHGPHSAACHADEDHDLTPHHHDSSTHQEGEDTDSHEHQALIESLLASITPSLAYSAPVPVITDLVMTGDWYAPLVLTPLSSANAAHSLKHPPHLSSERPPPASLQVARSIVLRV